MSLYVFTGHFGGHSNHQVSNGLVLIIMSLKGRKFSRQHCKILRRETRRKYLICSLPTCAEPRICCIFFFFPTPPWNWRPESRRVRLRAIPGRDTSHQLTSWRHTPYPCLKFNLNRIRTQRNGLSRTTPCWQGLSSQIVGRASYTTKYRIKCYILTTRMSQILRFSQFVSKCPDTDHIDNFRYR